MTLSTNVKSVVVIIMYQSARRMPISPPTLGSKLGQQQNPVGNLQENQPKSETKSETAQGTQTEASIMYVESNTGVLLQTAQSLVCKVGSEMDQKLD